MKHSSQEERPPGDSAAVPPLNQQEDQQQQDQGGQVFVEEHQVPVVTVEANRGGQHQVSGAPGVTLDETSSNGDFHQHFVQQQQQQQQQSLEQQQQHSAFGHQMIMG